MPTTTYGAKYNRDLTTTQIAALVRDEIKAAVKAKELPAGKYSVRKDGHRGIRVSLALEGNVYTPGYLRDLNYATGPIEIIDGQLFRPARYLPHVSAAKKKIEAMLEAYNYDGSDLQADYFHVNFYASVSVEADYGAARAALLAADADLIKAAKSAPIAPELDEEQETLSRLAAAPSNVVQLRPAEESDQVAFLRMAGAL